jgi:hypothetical protein
MPFHKLKLQQKVGRCIDTLDTVHWRAHGQKLSLFKDKDETNRHREASATLLHETIK